MPRRIKNRREVIIPIGPSIAYIPLNQGYFALIDSMDARRSNVYQWNARKSKNYIRILRSTRCRATGENWSITLADELLGKIEGMVIDHINGNTFGNRRCNLRHATQSQNMQNRKPQKNKSGHVGVYETKEGNWRVEIQGKYIETINTFEDDVSFRLEKEKELFGQFAPLARR